MATATVDLTVEGIRRRLAPLFALPQVALVVLFGSRARGTHRQESDIDLGLSAATDERDLAVRLLAPATVDTFDLRRPRPDIFEAVRREGILLYERSPGTFAEYLSSVTRGG